MNILFVMKYRGNAGNTHAVANYMRVAPKYGHTVAIYGEPSRICRNCSFRLMSTPSTASVIPVRVRALPHQADAGSGHARQASRSGSG